MRSDSAHMARHSRSGDNLKDNDMRIYTTEYMRAIGSRGAKILVRCPDQPDKLIAYPFDADDIHEAAVREAFPDAIMREAAHPCGRGALRAWVRMG